MTRILCLWLPNWPIQRIAQCRPELKGRPLALVTNGPRGGHVAICSRAAAAQGVRPGMPVAESQALVPHLMILPYEPARDRQALAKLAEACEQFSPCVALEEGDEPESLLLDISNLEHLWGSEREWAAQVEKLFTRRGYQVRLAIADTIGAAWTLARFVRCPWSVVRGENTTGNGLRTTDIPALPVESLRICPETAALLRQLGIETIDQLMLLPREGLASRFGDELLRRLDQLTGAASEILLPHRALAALEVGWSLEEPTTDRRALLHVLRELVERLSRQLAVRDEGAVLLMCLLRNSGGNTVPLRVGLLQPTASAEQIMELIELNLERVRLSAEVDRVEVRVAVVGQLGERQGELFSDRWLTDPHQLALLVNRLSGRLGHDCVLRATMRNSPVPERAVQWKPVMESRIKGREARGKQFRISDFGLRIKQKDFQSAIRNPQSAIPLLLHAQPQALEVVCIAPDGPPQFVWLAGRRQRIVYHAGPERIETLWWRGPAVRRDYYRVALESGDHLWIFRRLTDRRWFLHGAFG